MENNYTWRQLDNLIVYNTFYNLDYLIKLYETKVNTSYIVDKTTQKRRKYTKEEKEKKFFRLSELLVDRYNYNPQDIKKADMRGGENTKFTNKKLIISGNIVELYEYSTNLNYDFKQLISNKRAPYEGLEAEELEEKITENQIKSRRRTLRNYKRLLNCNIEYFKRFFTGTFAPHLQEYEGQFQDLAFTNNEYKEFIKRVKRYFKEVRNQDLDLHYIATIEPQKESTWNFHYHVLCDMPFIENRPSKFKTSEKEYIENKIEYIREKIESKKKVYPYEIRVLKLYEYRKSTQEKFEGIGLLDFLWSWGSVDYKAITMQKKKDNKKGFRSEKITKGNLNTKQRGLDLGGYMAKSIGDYMIKTLEDDGLQGQEFKKKIENKKLYLASTNLKRSIEILDINAVEEYISQNLNEDNKGKTYEFENTFISGKITKFNLNGVIKNHKTINKKINKSIKKRVYEIKNIFIFNEELLYREGKDIIKISESEYKEILLLEVNQDIKDFINKNEKE